MAPTPHLGRMPYMQQVLAALGVTVGRTRLMRLSGQAEVTEHADAGYYWVERVRVHVPISTQPTVRFHCGGSDVNMAAGECWIFDTWRQHRVINAQDDQRIHLVCDTVGGDLFWRMVQAGRPVPGPDTPNWAPHLIAPKDGPAQSLEYEASNVPVVMTPWEIGAHLGMLFHDARAHPNLPPIHQAAGAFTRQWRALWARYGEAQEGWPHYRQAVDAFMLAVRQPASTIDLPNGVPLFTALMAMIGEVAAPRSAAPASGAHRAIAMADRA